jgi:SAM-dependent methyltransferase
MNWRVKGLIQRTLSAVPGGILVNDWMQRSLGTLRNFPATIETKVVSDWVVLVDNMTEMGASVQGLNLLEVGTGWMPVLPVCFSLGGAKSCTTIDVTRHLNSGLTFRMLAALRDYLPKIAAASGSPLTEVEARYLKLSESTSVEQLLERANIRYLSPGDARTTGLPNDSLDVVFSNNVFEHVPGEVLDRILRESRRILKPGGLSIHSANCADHYAYFDRKITFINYLSYTDSEWEFWNTDLQYQNRLRPQEFVDLAKGAGLDIGLCKMRTRHELMETLASMRIAPEFQKFSPEQLCSTSILIGGVKAAAPLQSVAAATGGTRLEPRN